MDLANYQITGEQLREREFTKHNNQHWWVSFLLASTRTKQVFAGLKYRSHQTLP